MFAYNPTTNDMSGQIMGQGIAGAAQTRADAMGQMGQDIGGALKSIGGTIGDVYEKKADQESAYIALQQISKIFKPMANAVTGLEGLPPAVQGRVSQGLIGSIGALSQFAIAGMGNETRQQGQLIQQNAPGDRAQTAAQAAVAGGQGTISRSSIGYNPAALRGRSNP